MARLQLGEKVNRVIAFLYGLRQQKAAAALTAHGFSQKDLDEGWQLVRGVVGTRLAEPVVVADPKDAEQLDAWENSWFPIADATLSRHFPQVREKLFLNISQVEGNEVVVSVGTFVGRLKALSGGTKDERAAYELLVKRGLTSEVVGIAAGLLKRITQLETPPPVDLEEERRQLEAAERALWDWYLEWSAIARAAIKDRRLLMGLGFLRDRRPDEAAEEPEQPPAPEQASPAPRLDA